MSSPALSSPAHAVEVREATKTFGRRIAVDHVSFDVPCGSLCGFVGPNGSGKTTTLRMIVRIYHPDSGVVRVLGDDNHGPAHDGVSYLPEERGLYRQMRVGETIRFHAALKNHSPAAGEVDDWLKRLDLAGTQRLRIDQLSKGMSQKVQFICTVIARPRLAVLDEPFSGLDPVNAVVLRDAVLRLRNEGTTVILSTHDMETAETLCDRVLMIYRGKKVLDDTVPGLRRTHVTPRVRARVVDDAGRPVVPIDGVLAGVRGVRRNGDTFSLELSPDADSQAILHSLARTGRVTLFEVATPRLTDRFIEIVQADTGDDAEIMPAGVGVA